MRSGTGRHRRPRQTPAFIVAAGVTGAGIALPLLSAGSANAVSGEAWNRAAECESGGLWSANEGNGYYGGFQLSLGMWEEYGGQEFASRPDLASRAQQIRVAERILADQGPGGMPGCAMTSGVWEEYRQERGDDVDRAEEAEEAQAEEEIGGPQESALPEEAPAVRESGVGGGRTLTEESAEAIGEAAEAVKEAAKEAAERVAQGRHRGDPAFAEPGSGMAAGDAGGADRLEVPQEDPLSAIAVEYGVRGGWDALYETYEAVIGGNPGGNAPGQGLDLAATGR